VTTAAEKAYFQSLPPRVSGRQQIKNVATGNAAVSTAVFSGMTDPPSGPVMVCLQALTQDAYVRFGTTSTTGTTSSNGYCIPAGAEAVFWMDPNVDVYMDHIAPGGVGALRWYVCSPEYMGHR
jgi:hypothetical protein